MDIGNIIFTTLKIIGALGFFIYGMKVMSEGIQKAAGHKMRQILGAMTSNRYTGVATGFLITALLQSSSATTVMTVSFVNAGLISLIESAGVLMGANIGTTVTGWLVSAIGLKIKVSTLALPIIAFAFPMLFTKKANLKNWGEFMIGFGLLFLGLQTLKDAIPSINENETLMAWLGQFTNPGLMTRLLFVLVGTLITIIVQSSSAAMAITIILCNEGLPIEVGAAMILGENIGTTITATLAALVGNVHAKRAARIHTMFNVIGVLWMVFLLPYFIDGIHSIWPATGTDNPNKFTLAIFHTSFNIINVLLLIWFVPQLVKIATKLVISKGEDDEQFSLEYISAGLLSTPELSLLESKKEVAKMGKLTRRMLNFIGDLLMASNTKDSDKIFNRIEKYEDITDKMEDEISDYLLKVSEGELSEMASVRIRSQLSIVNDLERIADIIYQMSKDIQQKQARKIWFTPKQRNGVLEILNEVKEAGDIMYKNLTSDYNTVTLDSARQKENEINENRNKLRKKHLKSIEKRDYDIKSGIIYKDMFSALEKVGDHIINVTEAVVETSN
ncbi:MAG: Na/Pi cotransporter family protein [Flavobacteriales bacterium]|nr:Na/Pi cotransporter family protein [Flavobacteriales bacterium]